MLLLVAGCVDRPLLVGTVRDYSACDFDSEVFQTRVSLDVNKSMSVLSDRSLDGIHTQKRRQPGTIGDRNSSTHDTSLYGVEIPTQPADFLIGHGSHVEPAPPREDIGSHPRSRERSTCLNLPSTGEANRAFSGRHHPAR